MDAEISELLAHADWLRGLARRLVGPASADDAVQDTYVAALHSPPDPDLAARPWLSRVLRNATRMEHRSASRRSKREDAVAALATPATGADDAVARAETFRMLVELVLALPEPHRTTLVRHYFDGDTLAQIARRDGVPEATVRGRHKHALDQLRAKLDARGPRSAWVATFAPIATPAKPTPLLLGMLVMNKILIATVVVLVTGGIVWRVYPRAHDTTTAAVTAPVVTSASSAPSAHETAPPLRHVAPFASAGAREQLANQIANAKARRAAQPRPSNSAPTTVSDDDADLDKDTIRSAMREVIPFLADCYTEARPTLGADHLSIQAHFTITGDRDVGSVIDAKQLFDDDNKPLPAKLDDCMRSTLQTLELPPLGDGNSIDVTYPLLFSDAPP
jgi:RNA polymerase sigma factor (sigma-70 family)